MVEIKENKTFETQSSKCNCLSLEPNLSRTKKKKERQNRMDWDYHFFMKKKIIENKKQKMPVTGKDYFHDIVAEIAGDVNKRSQMLERVNKSSIF